jgi:hypothetical protein
LWKKVVRRRQYNDDALIKKHPGANTLRSYYFLLTVLGLVLPYCFFVPWVQQHGLNLPLMLRELFSTRIGAFFGSDVLLSALAAIAFIRHGGVQRRIRYLWLPIAFMRERQLAAQV